MYAILPLNSQRIRQSLKNTNRQPCVEPQSSMSSAVQLRRWWWPIHLPVAYVWVCHQHQATDVTQTELIAGSTPHWAVKVTLQRHSNRKCVCVCVCVCMWVCVSICVCVCVCVYYIIVSPHRKTSFPPVGFDTRFSRAQTLREPGPLSAPTSWQGNQKWLPAMVSCLRYKSATPQDVIVMTGCYGVLFTV